MREKERITVVHDVEINLPETLPGFEIKIDGVVFGSTCGVLVQSPMESGLPHTVVTLKIPANVRIRGKAGVIIAKREEFPGGDPIKGGSE